LDGKEINLTKFSFEQGHRLYTKNKLKINDTGIIIVEGIHALNPNLTKTINIKYKFKIYISALTQISIDSHNRISTTDNRLIRRIVRDYSYRNYSVVETLGRWESVKQGENKNIFPFQEQADVMFNSALLYELGVLKKYAEPLLRKIPENRPEYSEATRLIKFLSYFLPISDKEIPPTSILREFLGGSSFIY
jgi:uridine kinase